MAVVAATGNPSAEPRAGQLRLTEQIAASMESGSHAAARASTGLGKSLSYLVPAMLRAATGGERTLISTESIALQSQVVGKDSPVVADVIEELTGHRPSVAVLKGWSNTVCALATAASASEAVRLQSSSLSELREAVAEDGGHPLLDWAFGELLDADRTGDRATYPLAVTAEEWEGVSTTPDSCPGQEKCTFGDWCLPARARERASEADVVVTNHSMVAVQAAIGVPVVIGNAKLGDFSHLVLDEAHALPNQVRNQGSVQISAFRVGDVARSLRRALDTSDPKVAALVGDFESAGTTLAGELDRALVTLLDGKSVLKVDEGDPIEDVGTAISQWAAAGKRLVPAPHKARSVAGEVKLRATHSRLASLIADLAAASQHRSGVARWVEAGRRTGRPGGWTGAAVKLAPIDTAGALRRNVYAAGGEEAALSVAALSATLPQSHVVDLGLDAVRADYPTPFRAAYDASWFFAPLGTEQGAPFTIKGRRQSFDSAAHAGWAAEWVVRLVVANAGSALVLASTVAAGRLYAERLRREAALSSVVVHSQWDGVALSRVVEEWKADHGSVLVGTRSLMTGVDAPGGTCSLVVVDRVPRSASNPIDDARVERIMERLELDRWSADRMVYVSDAALLLEQAAGRLIRGPGDGGVVAVLDPRLAKRSPAPYPEPTRKLLMDSLGNFNHKTTDAGVVLAFLQHQAESALATA